MSKLLVLLKHKDMLQKIVNVIKKYLMGLDEYVQPSGVGSSHLASDELTPFFTIFKDQKEKEKYGTYKLY